MPQYKLLVLAEPSGGEWVETMDINEAGDVTGIVWFQQNPSRAVRWVNESPEVLDTSGDQSIGYGLNDSGSVVGVRPVFYPNHAMLWNNGQALNLQPHFPGKTETFAVAINDAGLVAGRAGEIDSNQPFLYDSASEEVQYLDLLPGHVMGGCSDVNQLGHAVGTSVNAEWKDERVFVFDGTQVQDRGLASWATGINNNDTVVGSKAFGNAQSWTAYRLTAGGNFEDLGFTSQPGYGGSHGNGINDEGTIVGHSFSGWWQSEQEPFRAFVYFPAGSADAGLHDLADVTINASDWTFESATGINNAGEIVGYGQNQGRQRGFVLRPTTIWDFIGPRDIEKLLMFIRLIGGVEHGGGGIGILPGGKPIPIDPHGWRNYTREQKDILLASIVRQMAPALSDEAGRVLHAALDEIIQDAAKKIARQTPS